MKIFILIIAISLLTGCTWIDSLKADILSSTENIQKEADLVISSAKEKKENVENTVSEVKQAADSIKKAADTISEITK